MTKLISTLLSVSLLLGTTVSPVNANNIQPDGLVPEKVNIKECNLNDISNHWAKSEIEMLYKENYVSGIGDGLYEPDREVTRAEFITMVVNALNLKPSPFKAIANDVTENSWYAPYVCTIADAELLPNNLISDDNFYPDKAITRIEVSEILAMVGKSKNLTSFASDISFTDVADLLDAQIEQLSYTVSVGLLSGYPNNTFKPQESISRAEASIVLQRLIELDNRLAIYVDAQNGSDDNNGKIAFPVKTLTKAFEIAGANNKNRTSNLYIFISGKVEVLDTIELDENISPDNGYSIIVTAKDSAQISGAKEYNGFELYDKDKNIYRVKIDDTYSREAFVNGIRAIRARSYGGLTNYKLNAKEGYYLCDDDSLLDIKYPNELEFVYYQQWTNPRCRASKIEKTDEGKTKVIMDQKAWETANTVTNTGLSPTKPYWYENAFELLDLPGEFYLDKHEKYFYYIPRENENPTELTLSLPVAENLFVIKGTADSPVHNITFDNVTFQYTTWTWPDNPNGFHDCQNNGANDRAPGAVDVEYARYIDFENCRFIGCGATGLVMSHGIQECNVVGNEFKDIGGGAFALGGGWNENYETEINPTEYKYFTINNKFNNNYVHDVSINYGSAAAVSVMWPKNMEICHNDIIGCQYTGIHIGWGWAKYAETGTGMENVKVDSNYISDVMNSTMQDGGCIYTLSKTNGGCEITNNYLKNARTAYGAVYLDEGSTNWLVANNVVDFEDMNNTYQKQDGTTAKSKWIHIWTETITDIVAKNNYSTTSEFTNAGLNNQIEDAILISKENITTKADEIIQNSGLEEKYLANFINEVSYLSLDQKEIELQKGESKTINTTLTGRKDELPTDYKIYYTSNNPSIAEVDQTGTITAKDTGRVMVYANVLSDGVVKSKGVNVICGDSISEVTIADENVQLIKGYTKAIDAKIASTFGRTIKADKITVVSDNTDVVTIDEDNKMIAKDYGVCNVTASYTYADKTISKTITVNVIDYAPKFEGDSGKNLVNADFFKAENWTSAQKASNGVKATGTPGYYTKQVFGDGVFAFDMKIDNPHSWPSIALRAPSEKGGYQGCYLIGFKEGFIELQKFDKNYQNTMFLGDGNALSGPGKENNGKILEYGKTYHVEVGSFVSDEGTRIILNVNGESILNYLDDYNNLTDEGYFGIYSGEGGTFTFTPTK